MTSKQIEAIKNMLAFISGYRKQNHSNIYEHLSPEDALGKRNGAFINKIKDLMKSGRLESLPPRSKKIQEIFDFLIKDTKHVERFRSDIYGDIEM